MSAWMFFRSSSAATSLAATTHRHHVTVTAATALARAFLWVPLCAQAGTRLPVLAEMAARRRGHPAACPGDLASALVILTRAGAHSAALTAGGARVQRLLAPPERRRLPVRAARLAAAAAALALPLAIAAVPLLIVACDVSR
jgi:hypothetical protein